MFRAGRHVRSQAGQVARKLHTKSLAEAKRAWGGRLIISEEVEHALQKDLPIIALESAIITHGMPYPTNMTTAQSLEDILRASAGTPATTALINGRIHIGLTPSQLAELSDPDIKGKVKVSRRDLGAALSMGLSGGTTVAGTMIIAQSVGIDVFVTGGIGGVHRGAEASMDISADLIELGRTPMAVICAGAKSILDIPKTLEVLETQGVCVASYGGKPDFPAFYTPSSSLKSPWQVSDTPAAANLIHTNLSLPQSLSTLLAVPIPSEHSSAGDAVQAAVEQAVRESVEQGVDKRGKEVTPWLLKRVGELSGGAALELNIKLIENNARVGADVAVELAKLRKDLDTRHASSFSSYSLPPPAQTEQPIPVTLPLDTTPESTVKLPSPSVLVFGSAALDITSTPSSAIQSRTTTPGAIRMTPGGVGRNIAEAAQNLLSPHAVQLVSALGQSTVTGTGAGIDGAGRLLISEMNLAGMRTDGLVEFAGRRTAGCSLMLDTEGDLVNGVADMDIVEAISPDQVEEAILKLDHPPKMVVFDLNLTTATISKLISTCAARNIPTFCDPTSTPKLARLIPALLNTLPSDPTSTRPLTHLSPNLLELDLLYSSLSSAPKAELENRVWEYINSLNLLADFRAKLESFSRKDGRQWMNEQGVIQQAIGILPFVENLWVKAGSKGVIHVHLLPEHQVGSQSRGSGTLRHQIDAKRGGELIITHYPVEVVPESEVVSTTGAGDTLVGGIVAGLVSGGVREEEWMSKALERVTRTIKSHRAVG